MLVYLKENTKEKIKLQFVCIGDNLKGVPDLLSGCFSVLSRCL